MRISSYLGIVLFCVVSAGCAATVQNTSRATYRQEGFSSAMLQQYGIAILPVTAGSNLEGYRRPFGQSLNRAADSLIGSSMAWEETMNKLNDAGLASTYQDAIVRYRETAIIDKALVRRIGEALGKRYMLFVQLQPFESESRTRYSALTRGVTTDHSAGVQADALIWDTQTGDVVWEGTGGARAQSSEFTYLRDSGPEAYSRAAALGLIKQVVR